MDQAEKFDHTLISQTREADLGQMLGIIERARLAKRETVSTDE